MRVELQFDMFSEDRTIDFNIFPGNDLEEYVSNNPMMVNAIFDEIATIMIDKSPERLRKFIRENMILSLITGFYKDADVDMPNYGSIAYRALFDAITLWSKEFMEGKEYERA